MSSTVLDVTTIDAGYKALLELRRLHVERDVAVRDALGHRNISATSVYLHALDDGTVGSIFE